MSTINGIGTKFYGISGLDNGGCSTATKWVTFLFFPIIPLYKEKIKRTITKPYEFQYEIIAREKLSFTEIIQTYIWWWCIIPLSLFRPLLLCIPELQQSLGFHLPTNGFNDPAIGDYLLVVAIIWMLFTRSRFLTWNEKRWLPTNYKELLKDPMG